MPIPWLLPHFQLQPRILDWSWSCEAMEMELRCSGAVDCLLALSFGFGEKCFVCKSLKLHIMASLAVSSSWPQTEPTDMHRATGQMGMEMGMWMWMWMWLPVTGPLPSCAIHFMLSKNIHICHEAKYPNKLHLKRILYPEL